MLSALGEIPRFAGEKYGDRFALVTAGREFSFRDLDGLSGALGHNLFKLGVKLDDRVTLYATNAGSGIASCYGALKTGAIINLINVMLTPAEVAYVTKDYGAKVLIGSASNDAVIPGTSRPGPLAARSTRGRAAPFPVAP